MCSEEKCPLGRRIGWAKNSCVVKKRALYAGGCVGLKIAV